MTTRARFQVTTDTEKAAAVVAEVGAARDLLRSASASLANGDVRLAGGLALLADAERQLSEVGQVQDVLPTGSATRVRAVRDALSSHLLAAASLMAAGVAPSVIRGVLFRGVVECEDCLDQV